MGVFPEIVELDCRRSWRRSQLPEEIQKDMRACNAIWIPTPKMPETPRVTLDWQWVWRPWVWKDGPSIPKQARFDLESEVTLPDQLMESLRPLAEEDIEEKMRDLSKGVFFALFLCVREQYTQGLIVEGGCSASLQKTYVLLGRQDAAE